MSENEVIKALFSQPKPIIFSMKGGLEVIGKGHHVVSKMNRDQHTEALMNGLKYRGQKVKEDWSGGDPWSIILSYANLKKPLNDPKLNAIWEKVKENKKWDDSYSSIEMGYEKPIIPEEVKAVQPDPLPEKPALPKQV